MDEKLDDGAYNTGTVLAVTSGGTTSGPQGTFFSHGGGSCVDLGVGYNATVVDRVRCSLSFETGF